MYFIEFYLVYSSQTFPLHQQLDLLTTQNIFIRVVTVLALLKNVPPFCVGSQQQSEKWTNGGIETFKIKLFEITRFKWFEPIFKKGF